MTADGLRLHRIESTDWTRVHEWASNPRASAFQPWGPNSESDTVEFVDGAVAAWSERPQTRWVWVAVDSPGFITGLGEVTTHGSSSAEISYSVDVALWSRGIGSAIAELLVSWAFENLEVERVEATCDPRNIASSTVLRRIGLTYEGRLRHTLRLVDGWRDSDMFSILRDEWAETDGSAGHVGRG